MDTNLFCPKCSSDTYVKSGIINGRQRYKCKKCTYNFTVQKQGKKINDYYVTKALQLYIEGISYREIERILGVSHVSVMNWVKSYKLKRIVNQNLRPSYKIITHKELIKFVSSSANLKGSGMIISELGDKFMLIKWERFKE